MPCLSTLFLYCPWFPFLSLPSCSSLPFRSVGALLTRSHLRFTPRRGLPLGRVSSSLASLHSSFARLHTPIDLSLCLHPPASLPLLLQSVVPYCYFLSSRGLSFLPPACCRSPSCIRCPYCFTICYFPRGASLHSLLLSFLLRLLPAVPHGSSFLLVDLLLLPPRSWAGFHREFLTYWVPSLTLWLFPVRFLCLLGFPSVRPSHGPLLGLARLCPCVLLFPLLCDSVESQFLCDGVLPTGRVSAVGGFVHSFSWFRFLSASLGVLSHLFRFLSFLLFVV